MMSGNADWQLEEMATRILSISPGSTEARQNSAAILAIRDELESGESLAFFALCALKTHRGRSAALFVTDKAIYVAATPSFPSRDVRVRRFPKYASSLRLTGPSGGEQVLHVQGMGLVLDAQQVSHLENLGLHLGGGFVSSSSLSIMPTNTPNVSEYRAPTKRVPGASSGAIAGSMFISHATEDGQVAATVTAELEGRGVDTWLATRDIQVGENYAAQIHDAIVASSHLVVLLSPASIASVHVQREVNLALDQGKALLPVVVSQDSNLMTTLPAQWKYWLGVVQVVPYSSAGNAVDVMLRSIGSQG